MAIRDVFKGSSTQSKLDDVQARLANINAELDALNIASVPTADLEAEEKAALGRLARREALHRVSSALSAELSELQIKLAAEKEEARRAHEAQVRKDLEAAKAEALDAIWAAYERMKPWKDLCGELDKVAPGMWPHAQGYVDSTAERLGRMLEEGGVAKVTQPLGGEITVVRAR